MSFKIHNSTDPNEDFKRLAELILNKKVLKVNNQLFRICAIEFYYNLKSHQDKATHKHKRQKTNGEWYFHGSGLDITIGNEEAFGGILIQAIMKIDENQNLGEFYGGPIKSMTALFEALGSVEQKSIDFGLIDFPLEKVNILQVPRVGLNPETVGEHYETPYRFITFPKKGHSKKGDIINYLIKENGISREEAEKEIYAD